MRFAATVTPSEARFAPILLRGPISELFSLVSQYEYDGIEVHLRDPHDVDWDEMDDLSRRYSLPVTTLGTGMAAGMDGLTFSDPNEGVRRRAVDRVKEHIKLAARLGSAVTIGSLNGKIGLDAEEANRRRENHFSCLKECCTAAAEMDVTILLEPLNRYECDWLNTLEDTLTVMEQIGVGNLKYLADTFHMNIEEANIGASIRSAGISLGYVHLVDSNRCGPGQGHLAVSDVLRALMDIGYDGYLSFECLPKPDADRALRNSLSYVKTLLDKLSS